MDKRRWLFGFSLLFMMGIFSLIVMSHVPVEIEGVKKDNSMFIPRTSATYYYCYNQSDIEAAITAIGTGEGIIVLANNTIELSSTINLDGGGNYTIESYMGTIINCNGDRRAFDITSAFYCELRDFVVDALSFNSISPIRIAETSNNPVIVDNITINGIDAGISSWQIGLIDVFSDRCIIKNSKFINGWVGIYVNGSNSCTIFNNEFLTCNGLGIEMHFSQGSLIKDNHLRGSDIVDKSYWGIWITAGDYCNLEGNLIENMEYYGIIFEQCDHNIIYNNTILNSTDNGGDYGIALSLQYSLNNSITKNNFSSNDVGINFDAYCDESEIKDNIICNNSGPGISMRYSIKNDIMDNDCSNNKDYGITLLNSNFTTISNNNCSNNRIGIGIGLSKNNDIINNTCNGNDNIGIGLQNNANDNIIVNNTCMYNGIQGIIVDNSDNLQIENNTSIKNYEYGIVCGNLHNSKIIENDASHNQIGFWLLDCTGNNIIENICINNTIWGIEILTSNGNNFIDNTCSDIKANDVLNSAGIAVFNSDYNNFFNNTCRNNTNIGSGTGNGYRVDSDSENNCIIGNAFIDNDDEFIMDLGTNTTIEIYCSTQEEIEAVLDSESSNTLKMILPPSTITLSSTINIDGGGKYVIEGQGEGTVISLGISFEFGSIYGFNITNALECKLANFKIKANTDYIGLMYMIYIDEINDNPVFIDSLQLVGNDDYYFGFHIKSDNCVISNSILKHLYLGLFIDNCFNTTIAFNEITNLTTPGDGVAMWLWKSSNNTIIFNNCSSNYFNEPTSSGIIHLNDNCNYNNITGNTINNNFNAGTGIAHAIRLYNSSQNIIEDNTCQYNEGFGIYMELTNDSIIQGNDFYFNGLGGIRLFGSVSNDIVQNQINNNDGIGLNVDDTSSNNTFYNNIFINNDLHALDMGTYNEWNSSIIGNYWDNYMGIDSDFNGIGDIPYTVTGPICDYLPIWNSDIELIIPSNGSTVSQYPPIFSLVFHDPNVNCTWYSLDGGLNNYSFTGDFIIDAEAWETLWENYTDGDPITITFYFNTTYGYIVSKSFTFYGQYIYPPDYTLLIIGLMIGGVSILGVSTILFMRNRIKNRPKTWTPKEDHVEGTIIDSGPPAYDEE